MDVTTIDVLGTAHSNSYVATSFLSLSLTREPDIQELERARDLLVKALSDTMMAIHMLSPDWLDTTYVGAW